MSEVIQIYILLLLLGGMVFFPAVVAPAIFSSLDIKMSGMVLRRLFPNYYLFIIVLALIASFLGKLISVATAACIFIVVTTVLVRQILLPKINQWRDEELSGNLDSAKKFSLSHRLTVILNLLQMALIVYAIGSDLISI
tara:strand:+ start:175 stop:591 length:417 start_codon:yes stop_codon:yes gene_type:complete